MSRRLWPRHLQICVKFEGRCWYRMCPPALTVQLGDVSCLPNFQFLSNLVVIRGASRLPNGEALIIKSTRTAQFGLTSLTTVMGPITIIGNSTSLCGKGYCTCIAHCRQHPARVGRRGLCPAGPGHGPDGHHLSRPAQHVGAARQRDCCRVVFL